MRALVHELYPGEAAWDALRVAISIGTAVELLLKHALALQSFHLLPDKYTVETALTWKTPVGRCTETGPPWVRVEQCRRGTAWVRCGQAHRVRVRGRQPSLGRREFQ
jgi:hypothetical protein